MLLKYLANKLNLKMDIPDNNNKNSTLRQPSNARLKLDKILAESKQALKPRVTIKTSKSKPQTSSNIPKFKILKDEMDPIAHKHLFHFAIVMEYKHGHEEDKQSVENNYNHRKSKSQTLDVSVESNSSWNLIQSVSYDLSSNYSISNDSNNDNDKKMHGCDRIRNPDIDKTCQIQITSTITKIA